MSDEPKTLIGVLASHDSEQRNRKLAEVLNKACAKDKTLKIIKRFRFVFTGGTYNRLFKGEAAGNQRGRPIRHRLSKEAKKTLEQDCGVIVLPPKEDGGVIILASLITQRKLSIVWPFFHPHTAHLLYPDNLALLRLADQWRVKKLLNTGSVNEWLKCEAERDEKFNLQKPEFKIDFPSGTEMHVSVGESSDDCLQAVLASGALDKLKCDVPLLKDSQLKRATIALISHDEMKQRMLDFVIDYEHELAKFRAILTTGNTGKLIQDASPRLRDNVRPYHSGPKGGDIEIATEVLLGGCNVVIFFVDPLHPHPHIEDIRVVFSSCMIRDKVPVLSNEVQARAWMDRRTRGI